MTRARRLAVAILLFTFASSALASWYDDYEEGLAAANAGNWAVVVQKMNAAIAGNSKENNKARTYGAIFINYHPYYYRGVAYLNTGKYQQAIEDLERTTGPGPVDLGPLGELLRSAKSKLQAASAPPPAETRPEPAPAVVQPPAQTAPATPAIDAALRQRAVAAINTARQKLQAAQQRKATGSAQYTEAMANLTRAITRNSTPKNNDDLNDVISLAENAGTLADMAAAPTAVASTTPAAPALTPKSVAASDTVLADDKARLRRALEQYFAGEFDVAARELENLSYRLPNNAWVFAFLGAAQYSRYAFEADEAYRKAAEASFRRAKSLRSWKGGLPPKYFSKRIRKAFTDTTG